MTEHELTLERDGCELLPDVIERARCAALAAEVSALPGAGSRLLLEQRACRALVPALRAAIPALRGLVAIGCTGFHKSAERNWLVSWHQDRSAPLADGEPGSSRKESAPFIEPPDAVLARMLAARLHLDDSRADNGPLRVLPGSHAAGTLSPVQIAAASRRDARALLCPRGGVILMRPLLLHASSRATSDAPRRVLHYLFAPPAAEAGLRWRRQD